MFGLFLDGRYDTTGTAAAVLRRIGQRSTLDPTTRVMLFHPDSFSRLYEGDAEGAVAYLGQWIGGMIARGFAPTGV